MYNVILVDDEPSNLESLERILKSDGATVKCFQDPREAISHIQAHGAELILTDLRMNSLGGLELLETVKLIDPNIEVIVLTAYGTVEVAVEAMKKGAYDFVTKPLQRIGVLKTVHRALERRRLLTENLSLREELTRQQGSEDHSIVGRSEPLRRVLEVAAQAARSRANVLIEGESGTGKGVIAEFIHRNTDGSRGMFVKINCTAIPENLLEAELFGFESGAFTGAMKRKKGRVELSHEGTLFLDEIGIAPLTLQTKLLRFLQDGEFERLGSVETLHVDSRVISATNTDLKRAISTGSFREDLYYRLNVIHIRMPPLRERQEDIPVLVQKFLQDLSKKNSRPVPAVGKDVFDLLTRYPWPGNIRELQNVIERALVLSRSGAIEISDLPQEISGNQGVRNLVIPVGTSLKDVEKLVMEETLKLTKGDRRIAAHLLGVHPRTIYRHLEASEVGRTVDESVSVAEESGKLVQNEPPLG